jgi:hypothetical protein
MVSLVQITLTDVIKADVDPSERDVFGKNWLSLIYYIS